MAAGVPLSAKNAKVRFDVGGANFALWGSEWEVDPEVNFEDTTSFEDGGFETQVACIKKAMVRISGFLDAGANPFDGPPALKPGERINNVRLYLDHVNFVNVFWSFPKFDILKTPVVAQAKSDLKITLNGKNWGTFSYPTGNFGG